MRKPDGFALLLTVLSLAVPSEIHWRTQCSLMLKCSSASEIPIYVSIFMEALLSSEKTVGSSKMNPISSRIILLKELLTRIQLQPI